MTNPSYIGRFAPSPTGPLHFGSLLAATASYLDARAHHGQWRLRIDDLDKPREAPGATDSILHTLDAFGLHWDGPVFYQSQHQTSYQAACQQLLDQGHVYYCSCSRQDLTGITPDQHRCRQYTTPTSDMCALRVKAPDITLQLDDRVQGQQTCNLATLADDFVVFRKDGYAAYQLATAVDEQALGITHIVRGHDLLDSAFRQQLLMQWLYGQTPVYAHIPVATHPDGQKLSKQSFAPALNLSQWRPALLAALAFLGQPEPTEAATPESLLQQAASQWSLANVPSQAGIAELTFCKASAP